VLQQVAPGVPFITVSGSVGETKAVELMRAGARDYVMKDNVTRLGAAVERELREAAIRRHRDQLEDQLHRAQRMEALGRLAGGVAHDFNNILMAIIGYADLALADLARIDRGESEGLREEIEGIRDAAGRATALTRQLLALGRQPVISSGTSEVDRVVQGIEGMLRRLIEADVQVETGLAAGEIHVRLDDSQLETILLNLCVNARDAMPDGGVLRIESAIEQVTEAYAEARLALEPGEYVRLVVSDTGVGMDAETRDRAFEPFFTTKEPGKGSGLGLATVYGIVTHGGGGVWLYSEPGGGTTVKLYLPTVRGGAAVEAPSVTPTFGRASGETVLLAEDEGAVRRVLATALERAGYHVLEAENGNEALRILGEHVGSVSVIVSDAVMPDLGGPDLARQVRETFPAIPVVLMSGYTDDALLRRAPLGEGVTFLQKPFPASVLIARVRELLDRDESASGG
jgi:two-component system, cell cycle sensor histidine kinase and response regulator CckA